MAVNNLYHSYGYRMQISPTKTKAMAFQGEYPVKTKIIIDYHDLEPLKFLLNHGLHSYI